MQVDSSSNGPLPHMPAKEFFDNSSDSDSDLDDHSTYDAAHDANPVSNLMDPRLSLRLLYFFF